MHKAGLEFQWSFENPWLNQTPSSGLAGDSMVAELGGAPASKISREWAPAQRVSPDKPNEAQSGQPGFDAALDRCSKDLPLSYDATPADAAMLLSAYHAAVQSVDTQLSGYRDDYAGCMKTAGYPDVSGYSDLIDWLLSRAPGPSLVPIGDEPSNSQWREYLVTEHGAIAADVNCRTEANAEAVGLLGPALDKFQSDHQPELAAVDVSWQQTVTKAQALGWDPNELVQQFD